MLQSIENGQRMGRVSLADLAGWESAFRGAGNQGGLDQGPPTMSLRDMVSQPEQQGNFMRNNTTGAVVNFDSQPQGQGQGQLPDYAQPIEIAGYGKGYRSKTDPFAVILADGRTVQTNVDRDATMARQRQALDMESRQLGNQLTLAQIAAAGRREAPIYQHVETPNGMMVFNPRTGELTAPAGQVGQPMQTKEQIQRSNDATAVMELTDQAVKPIQDAPGSYIDAAGNQIGRVIGMDTKASKAQAQLDVLAGSLVSKMPKMSGPQSDKDVAMYKQMAANLNDPTLPTSAKVAAMTTLRELNAKYATGYKGPTGAALEAVNEAKEAISKGAARDAVVKRLEQLGVTNHGL